MRYQNLFLFSFASAAALAGTTLFAQHQQPMSGQCVGGNCYPNAQNYGYYQNNWRRWPTMNAPPGSYGGPAFGAPAPAFQQQAAIPANPRPLPSTYQSALPPQPARNDVAAFQEPAAFRPAEAQDIGPLPPASMSEPQMFQQAHYTTSVNEPSGAMDAGAVRLPAATNEYVTPAAFDGDYPSTAQPLADEQATPSSSMQFNPYCREGASQQVRVPTPSTNALPPTSPAPGEGVMIQNPFATAPVQTAPLRPTMTVTPQAPMQVTPRPLVAQGSPIAVSTQQAREAALPRMSIAASAGATSLPTSRVSSPQSTVPQSNPLRHAAQLAAAELPLATSPPASPSMQPEQAPPHSAPMLPPLAREEYRGTSTAPAMTDEEVCLPPLAGNAAEPRRNPFRAATPLPQPIETSPTESWGGSDISPAAHVASERAARPQAAAVEPLPPQILPALPPTAGGNPLRKIASTQAAPRPHRTGSAANPLR